MFYMGATLQRNSISDDVKRAMRLSKIVLKWSVFFIASIFALVLWIMGAMIWRSGVNVNIHFVLIALFTLSCISLLPFVLRRVPKKKLKFVFLGVFGTLVTALISHSFFMNEFSKTSEGVVWFDRQQELEKIENEKKLSAEREKESKKVIDEFNKNSNTIKNSLENCINWRGQVPSLVAIVKNNLHNPGSFDHISTTFTGDLSNPVFVMTYRAENGYGAIRTDEVKAIIAYDDCSVKALEN